MLRRLAVPVLLASAMALVGIAPAAADSGPGGGMFCPFAQSFHESTGSPALVQAVC